VPWVNQGSRGQDPTGTESVTENTHPVTFSEGDGRKVKWWCKRPPLRQQCRWSRSEGVLSGNGIPMRPMVESGHDKPHLVQDQANPASPPLAGRRAARSILLARGGMGRSLREMAASSRHDFKSRRDQTEFGLSTDHCLPYLDQFPSPPKPDGITTHGLYVPQDSHA